MRVVLQLRVKHAALSFAIAPHRHHRAFLGSKVGPLVEGRRLGRLGTVGAGISRRTAPRALADRALRVTRPTAFARRAPRSLGEASDQHQTN